MKGVPSNACAAASYDINKVHFDFVVCSMPYTRSASLALKHFCVSQIECSGGDSLKLLGCLVPQDLFCGDTL